MMVIAVGLSSYNVALFHLVNHAFYKALLFLGAGAVIHAVADNQDFRKYGGLKQFLPLTYSVMLIASFSLVAFPFMTGFYSKDFILESAFGQFSFSSVVVYFIAVIGAMFTTLYSVKVLYLTFLSNPAGPLTNYKAAHEGDIYMCLPLIILAFFSIFFGYFTKDIFIGLGTNFYADNSIFIHPNHEIMINTEFAVPTLFKLFPLIFTITLSVLSFVLSEFYYKVIIYFKLSKLGYNIFAFFNQRFYLELFYNKYIVEIILKMGGQTTKVLDKGSIELVGPFGLEKGLNYLSKNISSLDTGVITNYALYILIGLVFYILIPYINEYTLVIVLLFGLLTLVTYNKFNLAKPFLVRLNSGFNYKNILCFLLPVVITLMFFKIPFILILKNITCSKIWYLPLSSVAAMLIFIIRMECKNKCYDIYNVYKVGFVCLTINITLLFIREEWVLDYLNFWWFLSVGIFTSLPSISDMIALFFKLLKTNVNFSNNFNQQTLPLGGPSKSSIGTMSMMDSHSPNSGGEASPSPYSSSSPLPEEHDSNLHITPANSNKDITRADYVDRITQTPEGEVWGSQNNPVKLPYDYTSSLTTTTYYLEHGIVKRTHAGNESYVLYRHNHIHIFGLVLEISKVKTNTIRISDFHENTRWYVTYKKHIGESYNVNMGPTGFLSLNRQAIWELARPH